MTRNLSGSSPASRGPKRSASTMDPKFGCEVRPDNASIAPSTASTPASTAASTLAAAIPLVLGALPRRGAAPRRAQPRHILDCQNVRAHRAQFFRYRDVVLQVVLDLAGVGQVARGTDRPPPQSTPVPGPPRG